MSGMPARKVEAQATRRVSAFEVEIETCWDRLTRLAPGKTRAVYLTPNWSLDLSGRRLGPEAVEVGTYTRGIGLADFRADCFCALEGR